MKNIFFTSIFISIFLSSCKKNIALNPGNLTDSFVVNASIENNMPPMIILTKSINYFSSLNPQLPDSSFVHRAVVTISNGTLTQQLTEYTHSLGNGYNLYFYSNDSSNTTNAFKGQLNSSYSLTINSTGENYTATTTIPGLNEILDSLSWSLIPFNIGSNNIQLFGKFTDPPGSGNYGRYFTEINNNGFLPAKNSVFDDEVIDGTTYTFLLQPGIDRNNPVPADSNFFKRGDTVTVKLCNIDKATYTFWSSWEAAYQSNINPFSQSRNVIGNINNGALGAFYGYAAVYKTIIIPQ
jgi:hypothetical protein